MPPEVAVNAIGYELVQAGRVPDAIQVLQLNVEAHPDSPNTYDSLADAYVAANDKAKAAETAPRSGSAGPPRPSSSPDETARPGGYHLPMRRLLPVPLLVAVAASAVADEQPIYVKEIVQARPLVVKEH